MIGFPRPGVLRLLHDREALIDDLHAYVTDPRPARNRHHHALLDETAWSGPLGISRHVFEAMMIEGVPRREDVAAFVEYCAATCVVTQPDAHSHLRRRGLTSREIQVVRLLAVGRSNREIADDLVLSVCTVKRHLVNIFTRLDVSSRAAAVAAAFRQGLV